MLNQVNLIGRLGSTPELRKTQSGKSVCSFSLATTDGYGESQRTEWHRVVAWEKTADFVAAYVDSGRLVSIVGRLQTREYERDGHKYKATEIIANSVQLLDSKPKQGNSSQPRQDQKPRKQGAQRGDYRSTGYDDDDVPY